MRLVRQPYKTARCVLYRDDQFLLAVHSSFSGRQHRRWGLPGGQIEWGESPESAVARELAEELSVRTLELQEIGPFPYKKALHMVYAARLDDPIQDWDDNELIELRWFSEAEVVDLKTSNALHANYELEAIRALQQKLGR